jgi:hypothetical protein
MAKGMDWARVNKDKQRRRYGTEDVDGRVRNPGEVGKLPPGELKREPEDPAGRAFSNFILELARSDFFGQPSPSVPKEVLKRLGLAAAQALAIDFLRRRDQYQWAMQKLAEEVAKSARGKIDKKLGKPAD